MTEQSLLGMPLREAEELLRARGDVPRVTLTTPPRRDGTAFDTEGREPFVVSVRGDELVVAYFKISYPRSSI